MISCKRNEPAYSIGTQSKDKLLILWKTQAEATKGVSSPGVWKYGPELLKLKMKEPSVIIGREK